MKHKAKYFFLAVVICIVGLYGFATLYVNRSMMFDDAFISFRYAKNFAEGYGITFNKFGAHTQGYTNFLLVLIMAPIIKMGIEPLRFAQTLNLLSGIGISGLVFLISKKFFNLDIFKAVILGLAFLPSGNTFLIATLGMETVIYTLSLFWAFYYLILFFDNKEIKYLRLYGVIQFLAFLLRPEALLLVVALVITVITMEDIRSNVSLKTATLNLTVTLVIPVIAYFVWAKMYYGYFLPNSFYVKATGNVFYSLMGIESVINYYYLELNLTVVAILSFFTANRIKPARILSVIFIFLFTLFYVRVDTLMDMHGRFLYPLTPFLFYLGIPVYALVLRKCTEIKVNHIIKGIAGVAAFILIFFNSYTGALITGLQAYYGIDLYGYNTHLFQKQYVIGKKLSLYRNIQNITIWFGDAGMIPYYSGIECLDDVGLNDSYIARERNIYKLKEYVFSKKPEIIVVATVAGRLVTNGHGPLGNWAAWAADDRWSKYKYCGVVKSQFYDMNFLIKKDYKDFDNLFQFMEKNVVDLDNSPDLALSELVSYKIIKHTDVRQN